MVVTYIANGFFILIVLFNVWFIIGSIIYREKEPDDLSGQRDRQEKNDDYNTNYHP
jgi:predicted membrane channel-forming protein YqfA (hemolysin III family)